jgi:hypothetical protein
MFERGITVTDVRTAIETGQTIELYPDDTPYPSRLVLGVSDARTLHVVIADRSDANEIIVITAYEPDPALWDPGFRRRKP